MKLELRAARINKSLTRKQVADELGVCEFMVGAYERGESTPRLETAMKLAKLYDVPIEDLNFAFNTH